MVGCEGVDTSSEQDLTALECSELRARLLGSSCEPDHFAGRVNSPSEMRCRLANLRTQYEVTSGEGSPRP